MELSRVCGTAGKGARDALESLLQIYMSHFNVTVNTFRKTAQTFDQDGWEKSGTEECCETNKKRQVSAVKKTEVSMLVK